MIILILFSFLAGMATIFAPCILPILPVVLSAGVSGGKKRPLGIVVGLVGSFTFFTLSLSYLTKQFGLSPDALRIVAIVVLMLFGLVLVVPKFLVMFEIWSGRFMGASNGMKKERNDFWGGILVGISLGLVWTPCVGPIVASVITLAATSTVSFASVFITAAYALGTSIPLLALIYGGQGIIKRVKVLTRYTSRIQQVFGAIMILTSVGMLFGLDRTLQTVLLTKVPSQFSAGLTQQLEQSELVQNQLKKFSGSEPSSTLDKKATVAGSTLPVLGAAPELTGITNWLNSDPLTLASLKGKVVLIDFWTYTCINCQRTLPYVTKWYDTYKDQGFVVIGVHSPEFSIEKEPKNVARAIADAKIKYPVAQDNDFTTWRAYSNQYWPAHYLIDANGKVRDTHFGEGAYEETEANIRALLKEASASAVLPGSTKVTTKYVSEGQRTPETYLGLARRERLVTSTSLKSGEWRIAGPWKADDERIMATTGTEELEMRVQAQDVYLVINPPAGATGKVEVLVDGEKVSGGDVVNGALTIDSDRLYHLATFEKSGDHTITLRFVTPGTGAFAFTFG